MFFLLQNHSNFKLGSNTWFWSKNKWQHNILFSSEVNKIYSELTNIFEKNDILGYKKLYNSKSLN